MRVSCSYGDVHKSPELESHIERKIKKIEKLVGNASDDMHHLQVKMEKVNRKEQYRVHVNLHFAGKTLHAEETSDNAIASSKLAFEELIRQIKTYKAKLRGRRHDGSKAALAAEVPEE